MEPRFRSRSYKRIKKRLPSGKMTIHFVKKKVNATVCAVCKIRLNGVKSAIPAKLKKMSKSKKTVCRLYGGYLCTKCVRTNIKNKYMDTTQQ